MKNFYLNEKKYLFFVALFSVLFYFTGVQQVSAQVKQVTVKGTVTTTKGQTLPGVTVLVKGTTNGITTDLNGKYSLSGVPSNATLRFSFVGMQTKEIPVNNQLVINITLSPISFGLNQVVVIGYGTQKKSSITGSVSVVDLDALPVKSPINTAQMLQGIAGVQVSNSGAPGVVPIIRIRGLSSLGNNNPLFVVDGIPTADTRDLNPEDIASIQILKDASAASIYGARAENGVVLITTKQGKGAFTIDFDARYGVDYVPRYIPMSNSLELARLDNMAHDNAGIPHVPSSDSVIADPSSMPNSDWERAMLRPGKVQDYNLSISKGDDNSSYRFALGYLDQEGIIRGPKFQRFDATISSTHKYKKLNLGTNIRLAYSNGYDVIGNPFVDILKAPPVVAIYNKNNVGGYGTGDGQNPTYFTNPVGRQATNINNAYTYKVVGNIFAAYKFTDYLKYKFNIGIDVTNQRFIARHEAAYLRYLSGPFSSLRENNTRWVNYIINHTLSFDKVFGKHAIDAVIGFSYEDHLFRNAQAYGEQIAQSGNGSYFWVLNAVQTNQKVSGSASEVRLYSEFARINYAFDNKYLIQLSVRDDHSSRFGPANRSAVFPGVSIGWKIKEESFLKNVDIISSLKLRASYGELGGEGRLGAYDYQGYINPNVNYVLGTDQHLLNGATQIKLSNENIKWQTTTMANIGIDFGLLENKIFGSIEYYISDTRNAIIPVELAVSTGNFGGEPYQNIGTIRNSGWELSLTYRNHDNEFKYDFNTTFGTLKNEVTSLGSLGQIAAGRTMTRVGYAIGTFYLVKTNGIFQLGQEAEAAKQGAHPGDIRFVDINGDGVINNKDRVMMGDPYPKVDLGLNVHFEYKRFDLSMFFYSALGFNIYNTPAWWINRTDDRSNKPAGFSPWTPTNPSNTTPIAVYGVGGARNVIMNQDRFLEKGNYMKLKNLEFGYTLSRNLAEKVGFKKLRVYFSGHNLFTLTNYTGWDPEMINSSVLQRSVDNGSFPNPRTVSFGIQGKF